MGSAMRKPPKYCQGFIDRHGKQRWYFRKNGKRAPLSGMPWSPEFMEAYEIALGSAGNRIPIGKARTRPGSVSAAVVAYYESPRFKQGYAKTTRNMRRAILERFRADHGDKRIARMESRHVSIILEGLKPFAARNWRKTLRDFFKFCLNKDWIKTDPTQGIDLARVRSKGFHTWTEQEIEVYEKHHKIGTRARLALALLLYCAPRRSDVVKLGWQHLKGDSINVLHTKNSADGIIPIHPELAKVLKAAPRSNMTFLLTEHGQPFMTGNSFGNWFAKQCNAVGLTHCRAHGLRKACCRRLAEAGCSEHQIAAVSGHKNLAEIRTYTAAARQAVLARDAIRAISPKREPKVSNRRTHTVKPVKKAR